MNRPALIIFSKVPLPGRTKSRLQEELTAEEAALFHRACLLDLNNLALGSGLKTFLYFSGGSKEEFKAKYPGLIPYGFEMLREIGLNDFEFIEQSGADLGERMYNAASQVLGCYKPVIIIGSDIPDIKEYTLRTAVEMLNSRDLVIGPAVDGGYYLIGLNKPHKEIFTGISWGSGDVLQQTMDTVRESRLSCFLLPSKSDIDDWNDLKSYVRVPDFIKKKNASYRYGRYLFEKYSEQHKEEDK